jgi:hypothetical protein
LFSYVIPLFFYIELAAFPPNFLPPKVFLIACPILFLLAATIPPPRANTPVVKPPAIPAVSPVAADILFLLLYQLLILLLNLIYLLLVWVVSYLDINYQ